MLVTAVRVRSGHWTRGSETGQRILLAEAAATPGAHTEGKVRSPMPVPEDRDPSPQELQQAAASFGLLSSAVRLHIIWALAQGESDVGSLADRVGGSIQAVSQHLAKLKLAGLVRSRREGRHRVYLVDDPHVVSAVRLMLAQFSDAPPSC